MTTNYGLGLSQLGLAPFGFGTPASADQLARQSLQDSEGVQNDARYIDPGTRDYVMTAAGDVQGESSVSQQVFLALVMTLGSSAVASLGSEYFSLKTIDQTNYNARIYNIVTAALRSLVIARTISLLAVNASLSQNSTAITLTVTWRDNTSGAIQTTSLIN